MRKTFLPCALIMMLFFGLTLANSQAENLDPPFLISAKNLTNYGTDLYAYDFGASQWQHLTSGGCSYGMAMSPDNSQVAFRVAPSFSCGEEARAQGYGYLLGAGWNIEVLDLTTGKQREIAGQPVSVELPDVHGAIERSDPAWSPDGQALAWAEQDYPAASAARLVIANLTTGETRVLDAALPFMMMSEDGLPLSVTWGVPGIVVFTNDPTDGAETLRLYNPVVGEASVIRFPDEDMQGWYPQSELLWVTEGTEDLLVVQAGASVWYAVNFDGDQVTGLGHNLLQTSATNSEDSLRLIWNPFTFEDEVEWQLVDGDDTVLESWSHELDQDASHFAIAPGGDAIAYLQDDQIHQWRDGVDTPLALPDDWIVWSITWGAVQWKVGASIGAIG